MELFPWVVTGSMCVLLRWETEAGECLRWETTVGGGRRWASRDIAVARVVPCANVCPHSLDLLLAVCLRSRQVLLLVGRARLIACRLDVVIGSHQPERRVS